jgi:hypothetical protein
MPNLEQLDILKQGVEAWNSWRQGNPTAKIDLAGAMLNRSNFPGIDLRLANLSRAALWKANLTGANLTGANLQNAILYNATFTRAILRQADFLNAALDGTIFANTDLGNALNLDTIKHRGPSSVSEDTIIASNGLIPESFLRGCGLTDSYIEFAKLYDPNFSNIAINQTLYKIYELRATQSIQIAPLFISYSHADADFVNHLDASLTAKGVRFWRDIHDAKAGRLETQIDRAIRQNPTVLLILSRDSIKSDWVEHEVRTARTLEKELGRDALCPIALDDSWKSSPWPKRVMEQIMEYNILDFSGWENKDTFESKFAKLLSGLDLFYKKPAP